MDIMGISAEAGLATKKPTSPQVFNGRILSIIWDFGGMAQPIQSGRSSDRFRLL